MRMVERERTQEQEERESRREKKKRLAEEEREREVLVWGGFKTSLFTGFCVSHNSRISQLALAQVEFI